MILLAKVGLKVGTSFMGSENLDEKNVGAKFVGSIIKLIHILETFTHFLFLFIFPTIEKVLAN